MVEVVEVICITLGGANENCSSYEHELQLSRLHHLSYQNKKKSIMNCKETILTTARAILKKTSKISCVISPKSTQSDVLVAAGNRT